MKMMMMIMFHGNNNKISSLFQSGPVAAKRSNGGFIHVEADWDGQNHRKRGSPTRQYASTAFWTTCNHSHHPRHGLRTKSILKVKTLEESLRSSCDQSNHLCRQSSSYLHMMAKLQTIQTKSNRSSSSKTMEQPHDDEVGEMCTKNPDAPMDQRETNLSSSTSPQWQRKVSFSTVHVRNYNQNTMRRKHSRVPSALIDVNQFEKDKMAFCHGSAADKFKQLQRKPADELGLSLQQRQQLLQQVGVPPRQIKSYLKGLEKSHKQQQQQQQLRKWTVTYNSRNNGSHHPR